jgi:hypothetical protein
MGHFYENPFRYAKSGYNLKKISGILYEDRNVCIVDSDKYRNNTENALLRFYGSSCSIYHIVDSDLCTSVMRRESIVAFP